MNLIINTHTISQDKNGFFSLNDLHKASGSNENHRPTFFMRNQQTQDLIQAIEKGGQVAYHTVKGGNSKTTKQGTFVCREIVVAYGMWINADFHLAVIRAFDAMNTGAIPCLPPKSTPTQRQPLVSACDKLAVSHSLRSEVYKMVGNHFGVDDVASIPTDKIPEAVAFVYELILAKHQNSPQPIPKVDNQVLYKVLCDSALRLCDYLRLLKKLSDFPMMDRCVGLNTQKTVADSYKSIVKLAGELRLTNHQGLPMFTTNTINFYHGGALVFG